MAWEYRPDHCARALQHIRPIEQRLRSDPSTNLDSLTKLIATCEVRTGGDPAIAIRRLDELWQTLAASQPPTSAIRVELVNAYLEIYDVLGRDPEFELWAAELNAMVKQGLALEALMTGAFPWVERARALYPKPAPPH